MKFGERLMRTLGVEALTAYPLVVACAIAPAGTEILAFAFGLVVAMGWVGAAFTGDDL